MNEAYEAVPEYDIHNLESMSRISIAEAKAMIEKEPLLRLDKYVRMVAGNDFVVTVNGVDKTLEAGPFICLRLAILEQMRSSGIMEEGRRINPAELEAAMVVHSTDRVVDEHGDLADTK